MTLCLSKSCLPARNTLVLVFLLFFAVGTSDSRADDGSTDKSPDPKILDLIGRVRAEEAKYQDLELVTKRLHRTLPGGKIRWTVHQEDETLDTVRQHGLFYAHVRNARTLEPGDKRTQELVSAFDGERTRTVEMGNSVNVHLRRYEPSQVVPPHAWVLAAWKVNFDLSTFLGGMDALAKDRKVRRILFHAGTVFEFAKLEFQVEGEETVDGLRCVKIHCERWNTTQSGPAAGLFWLALDRNLICARLQVFYGTKHDAPDVESVVKEWREIGPGLWLPARIHSMWKLAGPMRPRVEWDEDFTLQSAKLHPDHPAAFFRDVPLPKDLPTYTIDAQGHLADDALLRLKPVGDPQKRLQEVLEKIRENEQRYRSFEATIETGLRFVSPNLNSAGGFPALQEMKFEIVRQGRLSLRRGEVVTHHSTGEVRSNGLIAFDGTWTRGVANYDASIHACAKHPANDFAPHVLPIGSGIRSAGSLADWLTAEVKTDYMESKNRVSYLGSEVRDGLACDVLLLVTLSRNQTEAQASRALIWFAKDREYLPVRLERYEPQRHPTLPIGCTQVEALAEAAPGAWYPQRIRQLAFVATQGEGLVEDRLIVNTRFDTLVRNFTLDPRRPEAEFRNVVVPAGTQVSVFDADEKFVGRLRPEKSGIVTPTEEEWARLVLEQLQNNMKRDEPRREEEKRLATAHALIGKPPTQLPRTWVNGKPMTWNNLKGKTVLLYFWAMWDGNSCREARRLSDQIERLKSAGIAVVGAHAMGTPPADVDRAVKLFELNFPVCIDPPAKEKVLAWGPLWRQFGIRTLPAAAVIDATGHVVEFGSVDAMLLKARELARGR